MNLKYIDMYLSTDSSFEIGVNFQPLRKQRTGRVLTNLERGSVRWSTVKESGMPVGRAQL